MSTEGATEAMCGALGGIAGSGDKDAAADVPSDVLKSTESLVYDHLSPPEEMLYDSTLNAKDAEREIHSLWRVILSKSNDKITV